MTHYEKIKHMSLAKMADFLRNVRLSCEYGCDAQDLWYHNHYGKSCSLHCKQAISEWLASEVKKGENA